MKSLLSLALRTTLALLTGLVWMISTGHAADNGCRTGGTALAYAYVFSNPVYSLFYGSLDEHIAKNYEHFRSNGDSVRCAAALSQAFLAAGLRVYDPNDLRRRAELNTRIEGLGIPSGPQEPTLSSQLYGISLQLARLARALPAAADGDFTPYYTPTNEIEQMQMFAEQILRSLLQEQPQMRDVLAQAEPLIREAANLELRIMLRAAADLAGAH
jgi:hypothetical protein